MRACVTCKEIKPSDSFHRNPRASDGRQSNCKECMADYQAKYRIDNFVRLKEYKRVRFATLSKEERRELKYLRRYGISLEDYENFLDRQGGACAICGGGPTGQKKRLCVDHCHKTGQVRGLLCNNCNVGLGRFSDDQSRLVAALAYLDGWAVQ